MAGRGRSPLAVRLVAGNICLPICGAVAEAGGTKQGQLAFLHWLKHQSVVLHECCFLIRHATVWLSAVWAIGLDRLNVNRKWQ